MYRHTHHFKIDSLMMRGHCHRLTGYTESIIGVGRLHFHFFSGISNYTDHTHYFSGITGLPVKTENGHIHKIEGFLESNSFHEHKFNGYTFEEISYSHDKKASEVLT
ncbi:MAG: hypothetical protein GX754_08950 [Clostridiaceae bacterium]|nr:hypothetical protein [Clostridiaceae bacterium]